MENLEVRCRFRLQKVEGCTHDNVEWRVFVTPIP